MLSEAELVDRYRETGEGRWFEELYRSNRRRVFGVCLKILRDSDGAQDACHEAFLRAFERFGTLRGDGFSSWVCRIAANHCYDRMRRVAKGRDEGADELTEEDPSVAVATRVDPVEREAVARERLQLAVEIVRRLAPHQREVFLLKHLEGKSYHEIELRTGLAANEVRSYLQNARRNVRLAWERQESAERGNAALRLSARDAAS